MKNMHYPEFFTANPVSDYTFEKYLSFVYKNNNIPNISMAKSTLKYFKEDLKCLSKESSSRAYISKIKKILSKINLISNKAINAILNEKKSTPVVNYINKDSQIFFQGSQNIDNIKINNDKEQQSQEVRVKRRKLNLSTSLSSNSSESSTNYTYNNHINSEYSIVNTDNDDDSDSYDIVKHEGISWNSIDYHEKRICRYNFLTGGYQRNSKTDPNHCWNVDHRNVSSLLMEYREKSKQGALHHQNLSDSRILSLSFVFLFCPLQKTSCLSRLESDLSKAIFNTFDIKQHWISIFNEAWNWCIDIDRIYSTTFSPTTNSTNDAKRKLMQLFLNSSDNTATTDNDKRQLLEITSDTLLIFINKFHHWIHHCSIESSFINQHLMPILENIFERDDHLKGKLGESYVMNGKGIDDNGNASLMADYTISYVPCSGISFDLLVIEVKPIGKNSLSQPQSDLVKLGKEMKRMVDCLVDASIEQISVGGVLVEGVNCYTYIMDLEYDGVYRMVQIGEFHLLRDVSDILLIPKVIEYFLQVRSIILNTVNSINKKYKNHDNNTPITSTAVTTTHRKLFKRHACGSPVKVSVE